jgi:hypothetical protein
MLIHGDEGHSCYDGDGQLTCVIAKMLLSNGPDWRELADATNAGDPTEDIGGIHHV